MQKELLETRHALYSTELELEKERGVSHELRMRLRAVTEVANESQQQQTKNQVESVQLRVKYDAMAKQCESLMSQAATTKMHEAECKIKIRNLEENLRQRNASYKRMEEALNKLERDGSRVITAIDQYVWPYHKFKPVAMLDQKVLLYAIIKWNTVLRNIILYRILILYIQAYFQS